MKRPTFFAQEETESLIQRQNRPLFPPFAPVQIEPAYYMDSPNLDDLESIERRLTNLPLPSAPASLRSTVLKDVHRSLNAQRWDRRMGRVAVALLAVGIGLNATAGWRGRQPAQNPALTESRPDAIARVAVLMAEATDAETGRQFARRLAALDGMKLSPQQEASIQQQIEARSKGVPGHRKDG
jgi:hypothetical protein